MAEQLPEQAIKSDGREYPEDPPPLLGTWRRMYFVVIGWLTFLIVVFYLFARRFAP
jgi:hypothetical protein